MSPASLSMLEQLMAAQAQECVFEGLSLPAPTAPRDCLAQLHLAQEAAQVRTGRPCPGRSGAPNLGLAKLQWFSGQEGLGQGPGWSRGAELGAEAASVRAVSVVPQPAVVLVPVGPPQGQQ